MNNKVVIVILAVACVGLGIALFVVKKQADERHATDVSSITDLSKQVVNAGQQLKEKDQVNLTLSNQVAVAQEQVSQGQEKLSQLSNRLTEAATTLTETRTSLASAEETVTNLNARIADLEAQNKVLDDQVNTLSNQLARLNIQIEETKAKLAVATTNATFLKTELQKQLAQRAELEHKFYDLDELRAQVRRVKDELFVARRAQLMKYDTGNKKGAQLLMMHTLPAPPSTKPPTAPVPAYDLNVEVGSDGTVRVIPPLGSTNRPAH
jgi:chromosome segregation ATPase